MSALLVKRDANLSQAHVAFLNGAGYSAERVTDEGLSGADDATVWQRAVSEGGLLPAVAWTGGAWRAGRGARGHVAWARLSACPPDA